VLSSGGDKSGCSRQAIADGYEFLEFRQQVAGIRQGRQRDRQSKSLVRLDITCLIDRGVATFLNDMTQNVALNAEPFPALGHDFRRLELSEQASVAEGVDPHRLEARKIAREAMDRRLDRLQVLNGGKTESV
jgi:hypothetical protein